MNLLQKLTGKRTKMPDIEKKANVVQPAKYSFVESYVIKDPKTMLVDYEAWALCQKMPVAYENSANSGGWMESAMLDTSVILPLLRALKKAPKEIIENPKMRTVSVVNIANDYRVYVLPNPSDSQSIIVDIKSDNNDEYGWLCYMTPEKRRAIVDQMKIHTR